MIIRDITISQLRDYKNNPRNNDLAVEKVKYSIERFGFLFPVIIDVNFVIVAGHTRIRACRELGIQSVPCIIADELTDEQINFFRLVDNKTSEYSDWDFEKLKNELAQIDLTLDKNQILLERFELSAQVFDLEPEQVEIKIPTLNFIADKKPTKSQISTIYVEDAKNDNNVIKNIHENEGVNYVYDAQSHANTSAEDIAQNTVTENDDVVKNTYENENINYDSDVQSSTIASAEDIAQHIAVENSIAQSSDSDTERKKFSKPPVLIQFRFGDIVFYISQVELDMLNIKYAEYIDSNEISKRSFVDYLLERVEKYD